MAQGSQLWQNERMKAFFRAHIRRESQLDEKAAEKLAEALTRAVNFMRVRKMPDDVAAVPPVPLAPPAAAKDKPATPGKPDTAKSETAFDPYAFSAMVVLTKMGREGLAKRLADIKGTENLRKFAEAQHLGIDRSLTKVDELRKAILQAAVQRLADRRAAAS